MSSDKSAEVRLTGTSPLLMHAFPMSPIEAMDKMTPAEQAETAVYRLTSGQLYVPGVALQRALVAGAAFSKGKGRGSLQKQVAACLQVYPEHLLLGQKEYAIDSRPVVIAATRGRIMRHRPRFDVWEIVATLTWDPALLSEANVREIVDNTGSRVGVLDFRPERKGPFGRFRVDNWSMVTE